MIHNPFYGDTGRVAISDLEISEMLVTNEWYTVLLAELKQ